MIVYLDLVIITNIIVDYAFLKTIALLYHEHIKWYRLIMALLLGEISLLLFIIPVPIIYNFRYIIGLFMGLISYNVQKPSKRILMILSFYSMNILFIGSLVIFKIDNIWFLLGTVLYVIIMTILEKTLNRHLKIKYEYVVKINNQEYLALLDSGNSCYYRGIPIVFIRKELFSEDFQHLGSCIIKTINDTKEIDVYSGPMLTMNKNTYLVVYCFSQQNDYEIILNSIMGE